MSALRRAVTEQDPNLAVSNLRTMDDGVSETLSDPRFEAILLSVFSAIALLLAAIGTYGVLAFDVASRTHEIGLRMALGAERRTLESMILGRAAATALIGMGLGVGGALALTRILRRSLFEITPYDPGTLMGVSAILFSAALIAAAVPAWRRLVSTRSWL